MGKTERKEWMLRNGGLLLEKRISYFGGKYSNPIRSFSAKELQKATNNYNENLIFDYGVQFKWYKGFWENRVISVKIFADKYHDFFLENVINEISVAAQLSGHKNALKLLGCCLEAQIPILVYEFPTNGNLIDNLKEGSSSLSWKSRLKIMCEIASVVAYLHAAFPRPILNRDIIAQHFYLDQDYSAKLSDFLFSISLPEGKTQLENQVVQGTCVDMAPEVFFGVYSEKSDVFSVGMLLLNLLTGKDYGDLFTSITKDYNHPNEYYSMMDCIHSHIRNHGVNGIVDPIILAEGEGINKYHQLQVFQLFLNCCRVNKEERPTMVDAAKELRRIQRENLSSSEANHD